MVCLGVRDMVSAQYIVVPVLVVGFPGKEVDLPEESRSPVSTLAEGVYKVLQIRTWTRGA